MKLNYDNCLNLIKECNNKLWNHILDTFDDSQINSLLICLYLCINKNNNIGIERILKLYNILFSHKKTVDLLTETDLFYEENISSYSNIYNTFLGILMTRISISEVNYEMRVIKVAELFYKLLKNKVVRPRFFKWLGLLIDSSRNFKNNHIFDEEYDINLMDIRYFRLLFNILLKLWDDTKKKEGCSLNNINMDYPKNKDSVINLEIKTLEQKIDNKFLNDIYFMIIVLLDSFYNNLESLIVIYKNALKEMKIHYRQLTLSGFSSILVDIYLTKITDCNLEIIHLEFSKNDIVLGEKIKKFQKDYAEIINKKIKLNMDIPDYILEINIDLINNLKIYEDSFYNYNYINFENSVSLINYKHLRNPFVRNKYCFYASYYILDNQSKNYCDLRFKIIENILIPNLIHFYIDLEKLDDDSFYEKSSARSNIIIFLNFITLKEPLIYNKQLQIYNKKLDGDFIRFVNLYINDISLLFDDMFEIIIKINKIEKNHIHVSLNNSEDFYLDMENHLDLYIKYNLLKKYLVNLKNIISFFAVLAENTKDILMSKELGEKICSQLNYYLNEITHKDKRKLYNIKNKSYVEFKPLELLNFFVKNMLSLSKHSKFVNHMTKDVRSFNKSNILFAVKKLWSSRLLTNYEYRRMDTISIEIEKIMKDIEEIEIPDEFCDPLMACEILEPVILPDTDIIMEKSVISRHLLTDLSNPFNRAPLTLIQLEEFNNTEEIINKVKLFMIKKEEWKNTL